jgi:hypothetical protein
MTFNLTDGDGCFAPVLDLPGCRLLPLKPPFLSDAVQFKDNLAMSPFVQTASSGLGAWRQAFDFFVGKS